MGGYLQHLSLEGPGSKVWVSSSQHKGLNHLVLVQLVNIQVCREQLQRSRYSQVCLNCSLTFFLAGTPSLLLNPGKACMYLFKTIPPCVHNT